MNTVSANRAPGPTGALVLGDGYLASFLLPHLDGEPVLAISRSGRGADPVGPTTCERLAADLFDPAMVPVWSAAARRHCGDGFAVYVLLPPSALGERSIDEALPRLVDATAALAPRRLVVVSSSGVYGALAGDVVDANSEAMPDSPRAERLLAIEDAWRGVPCPRSIVRLAGLYGPGRIIGRRQVERGEALPGDGNSWLNLIHVDDAARALHRLAHMATPPALLLLSDGRPYRRREYYAAVAPAYGRPPPRFEPARARRGVSRRINPSPSWAALDLSPAWPDARQAVARLLDADPPTRE